MGANAEAKFILTKLGRTLYPGEDMDVIHEKALDCCDEVAEEALVDVYLYDRFEDNQIFVKSLFFLFQVDGGRKAHK